MASWFLLFVGVLFAARTASADRSLEVELAGGLAIPLATTRTSDETDTGWKIAGRGTKEVRGQLAIVGIEFARIPSRMCDRFDRLRAMVGLAEQWKLERFSVSARIAAGADAVSCTYTSSFVVDPDPVTRQRQRFDLGLGAEAAATLWLIEGVVDIGIEVGIPMSFHWRGADSESPNFEYVSADVDVLLAFRIR